MSDTAARCTGSPTRGFGWTPADKSCSFARPRARARMEEQINVVQLAVAGSDLPDSTFRLPPAARQRLIQIARKLPGR